MNFDLEKRVELAKFNLEKQDIGTLEANVCICLDISGSMDHRYKSGQVQDTIDRAFGIAMNLDPDKALDVFVFDTSAYQLPQMKQEHYGKYIKDILLKKHSCMRGTNYAPVIDAVSGFYSTKAPVVKKGLFGLGKPVENTTTPKDQPIFCIYVTDGSCGDARDARRAFQDNSTGNVYFQCLCIGDKNEFEFLEKQADDFGHIGFTNMNDLRMSDDDLYTSLINDEFAGWIKNFQK